jgi:hypothetical protein
MGLKLTIPLDRSARIAAGIADGHTSATVELADADLATLTPDERETLAELIEDGEVQPPETRLHLRLEAQLAGDVTGALAAIRDIHARAIAATAEAEAEARARYEAEVRTADKYVAALDAADPLSRQEAPPYLACRGPVRQADEAYRRWVARRDAAILAVCADPTPASLARAWPAAKYSPHRAEWAAACASVLSTATTLAVVATPTSSSRGEAYVVVRDGEVVLAEGYQHMGERVPALDGVARRLGDAARREARVPLGRLLDAIDPSLTPRYADELLPRGEIEAALRKGVLAPLVDGTLSRPKGVKWGDFADLGTRGLPAAPYAAWVQIRERCAQPVALPDGTAVEVTAAVGTIDVLDGDEITTVVERTGYGVRLAATIHGVDVALVRMLAD